MHDFDNNTKLDGLELFKAMSHVLPSEMVDEKGKEEIDTGKTQAQIDQEKSVRLFKYVEGREKEKQRILFANCNFINFTDVVDKILEEDDLDKDGYLTYWEFVYAREKQKWKNTAAEKQKKQT